MQKSARNFGSSFKAKAGNAAVAFAGATAGAYGVASEGLTAENIKSNIGGVASAVSFFARSSPSVSPSAFSAQNLKSELQWFSSSSSSHGSESIGTTTKNAAKALAGIFANSGRTPTYASRYGNSGVSVSGGWLR